MEAPPRPTSTSLFQVYLRLRPALNQYAQQALYPQLTPPAERFLTVETPLIANEPTLPTHITIHPPSDSRKRAVEKFAFTTVFEEEATQLDIFRGTGAISLVEGVLGEGRDGLLATLGVTGSGKVRTEKLYRDYKGLMLSIEPYDPRLEIATRINAAFTRSPIPVSRLSSATSYKHPVIDFVSRCCRRLRSPDTPCFRIP